MKLFLSTFTVLVVAFACTPPPTFNGDLVIGEHAQSSKEFFQTVDIVNSKDLEVRLYVEDFKSKLIDQSFDKISSESCSEFKSVSVDQLNYLSENMNDTDQYRVRNYYFRCHAEDQGVALWNDQKRNHKTGVNL